MRFPVAPTGESAHLSVTSFSPGGASLTTITKIKLAFSIMGLILFAAGVRLDDARLRSLAIAFVAIAWVLRFVRPRTSAANRTPPGPSQERGD